MEFLAPADRFAGTFKPVLDPKNRVTVPATWRTTELANLFALMDEDLGIIVLMPPEEMTRTGHNVHLEPGITPAEIRQFRRFFFAKSVDCPLDSQGRILLPVDQLQKIGLGKDDRDLVMVGVGERIEVWPAHAWEASEAEQKAQFNQLKNRLGF